MSPYEPDYSFPDPDAAAEDERGRKARAGLPPIENLRLICPDCKRVVLRFNPPPGGVECTGDKLLGQLHEARLMLPLKGQRAVAAPAMTDEQRAEVEKMETLLQIANSTYPES